MVRSEVDKYSVISGGRIAPFFSDKIGALGNDIVPPLFFRKPDPARAVKDLTRNEEW